MKRNGIYRQLEEFMNITLRLSWVCVVCGILLLSTILEASPKSVTTTGEYIASAKLEENEDISEDRARTEAKRSAVEEVEVYVKAYSKAKGYTLKSDELTVMSAGILHIQNESVKKEKLRNGDIRFIVTIMATADSDRLNIAEILKNKEELEYQIQLKNEMEEQYQKQKNANEEFKRKYADKQIADAHTLELISQERKENEENYQASRYLDLSFDAIKKDNLPQAIELSKKVLLLNPKSFWANANIGFCNFHLENGLEAVKFSHRALELASNDNLRVVAYKTLAVSYGVLGFQTAQENPEQAIAYGEEAIDYQHKVIAYGQSLDIHQQIYNLFSSAHLYWGIILHDQNNYEESNLHLQKAVEFENLKAQANKMMVAGAYGMIGFNYYGLGDNKRALDYLDKSLAINPTDNDLRSVRENIMRLIQKGM